MVRRVDGDESRAFRRTKRAKHVMRRQAGGVGPPLDELLLGRHRCRFQRHQHTLPIEGAIARSNLTRRPGRRRKPAALQNCREKFPTENWAQPRGSAHANPWAAAVLRGHDLVGQAHMLRDLRRRPVLGVRSSLPLLQCQCARGSQDFGHGTLMVDAGDCGIESDWHSDSCNRWVISGLAASRPQGLSASKKRTRRCFVRVLAARRYCGGIATH